MRVVKEMLDRLLSFLGLVLLSPLFAALALWIVLESGRPVIFRQRRAGKGAKPFSMLKFRTMVPNAVELGRELQLSDDPFGLLPNDPRITRSGRFLRRTSLDELPQLLNVLKGDMSMVGPRPEQVELVRRYAPEHEFRLAVKPGVTGPMQVFGRGELSFEERLAVEREYIENLSLSRDLRILALTIPSVLAGRGAY
jgi:lipopolysaccharide/colanic/teichoic acid biosynthesis glycosyltransferase